MSHRKEKLEEQIKRIVSELLIREIKDPRIGFVTVTGVDLAKDFSTARIGISVLGDARDFRKSMEGLQSATSYIQHRVGKSLGIRITPKILFFPDSSIAEGTAMVHLLNTLEASEKKEECQTDSDDDANHE
ncbi:MAG: 30S ribosome-binding factor RbfA [Spirochaetes bacterium]|nr:30S ribosome-binding factor RbfA [Spirochaetota bacterium]